MRISFRLTNCGKLGRGRRSRRSNQQGSRARRPFGAGPRCKY